MPEALYSTLQMDHGLSPEEHRGITNFSMRKPTCDKSQVEGDIEDAKNPMVKNTIAAPKNRVFWGKILTLFGVLVVCIVGYSVYIDPHAFLNEDSNEERRRLTIGPSVPPWPFRSADSGRMLF